MSLSRLLSFSERGRRGSVVLEPPFFIFIPLSAFDLPLALRIHYTPSLLPPFPLLPLSSGSLAYPSSRTSAEPSDKTDPYLQHHPLSQLYPTPLPFSIPKPYQRNDRFRCIYAGGRPTLYEVTTHLRARSFARKECPLHTQTHLAPVITPNTRESASSQATSQKVSVMPTSTATYAVAFDLANDTDGPCSLQSSAGHGFAKFLLVGDVTSLGLMAGTDYHYRLSWQGKEYSVR